MCPLSVSGAESGRYFWTARSVNPGHVEKQLLMDFSRVCFGGLNAAWWRYLLIMAFDFMAYALHVRCLLLIVSVLGVVALQSCNGNIHNLVCSSIPHFHTSF